MLTILTLEIFNSGRSSKERNKLSEFNYSMPEIQISDKIKEEQLRKKKYEKTENYITILPLLILLFGIIVMYILEKIFLK